MFNELVAIYNQAIDEASAGEGGEDKKFIEKEPLTEE